MAVGNICVQYVYFINPLIHGYVNYSKIRLEITITHREITINARLLQLNTTRNDKEVKSNATELRKKVKARVL